MSDKTKAQVDPPDGGDEKKAGTAVKSARKPAKRSGTSSGSKSAFVSGGTAGKGAAGKAGRRPVKPVKVASAKPWGTIGLFALVGVVFVVIIGYTGYQAWYNAKTPQERAAMISGIQDYTKKAGKGGQHETKDLSYDVTPPIGGPHNPTWQNCMGDVYNGAIAEEHAVHSMEHGAVWITYRPDLPKSEVDKLVSKVRGKDYMMLSQHPKQDTAISVQSWGYQLKVDKADDARIDDFIKALRNQGPEKGASCSGGITVTGDKPRDLPPPQQPGAPGGGQPGAPGGAPGGQPPAPQPGG